ncbi:hypothetical protein TIFTF001_004072 [Ficus carica]|uniref:Uncharacterized protein n=1 Tax=Ficus carica TaxID=3494 RepID=A0AA88DC23_FICCA|nr:hypothetical protein TIFTF001_004072 [Ficus carica]
MPFAEGERRTPLALQAVESLLALPSARVCFTPYRGAWSVNSVTNGCLFSCALPY